jgi:exosortase family protein XrtG
MTALLWFVPLIVAWAVAVRFFWKAGAWLPYFVVGATGMAFIAIFMMRDVLPGEEVLRMATAVLVHNVSWVFGIHTELIRPETGDLLVVGVPHHNEWTRLSIGIECSGLLETGALLGLVSFFPAVPARKRVRLLLFALVLTFLANVVRMLVIVGAVAYAGQDALEISHVVLGRLVFFVLTIGIYWFAITKPTLQTVGMRLKAST